MKEPCPFNYSFQQEKKIKTCAKSNALRIYLLFGVLTLKLEILLRKSLERYTP